MAMTPTIDDASAVTNDPPSSTAGPRSRVLVGLSVAWLAAITWWVSSSVTELRVARALIARAGAERGSAITKDEHFADLPELYAEFDALGLLDQNLIVWLVVLAAFAITGAVLGIGLLVSQVRQTTLYVGVMSCAWLAAAVFAAVNADTLDLLTWLDN